MLNAASTVDHYRNPLIAEYNAPAGKRDDEVPMRVDRATLYAGRRLSEMYPGLERLYDEEFNRTLSPLAHDPTGIDRQLMYLSRVVGVDKPRVAVIGCGPQPTAVRHLLERGYDAVGIEPLAPFVRAAGSYVGAPERVLHGTAESLPLPDASVQLVYCNSVLEHVDAPTTSLREMARVLRPGGAAFIVTTNRYRVSLRGENFEYAVPFLNWMPRALREAFAFHHLHYEPHLARYTDRPAVHWFSYADLCALGREAGFAHFYSTLDLFEPDDAPLRASPVKRWLVDRVQCSPWLRALFLTVTYFGGSIIMVKRADAAAAVASPRVVSG
jgi:SAM-dependent methyltransferase